jgi:hypothetical protein
MNYTYIAGVIFAQVISFSFGTMVGYDKCRQDIVNGIMTVVPDIVCNKETHVAHPH